MAKYTDSYGNTVMTDEERRRAQEALARQQAAQQRQQALSGASDSYGNTIGRAPVPATPTVQPPATPANTRNGVQMTGANRIGAIEYGDGGNPYITYDINNTRVKPGLPTLPDQPVKDPPKDKPTDQPTDAPTDRPTGTASSPAAEQFRLGREDVSLGAPGQFNGTDGYSPFNARGVIGNYDPNTDAAYVEAMNALRQAQANMPGYNPSYGDDLASIYAQITGREPFSYDLDADMLYQQYRQQYTNLGQQAMQDTMGQAAGLTGGYGSSYAQNAGQQAYNAYLNQLNDRIPELEERAYQRWLGEGDRLNRQYALTRDLADQEYAQYRDAMSDYYNNVAMASDQVNQAYGRGVDQWNREAALNSEQAQRDYQEWASGYQLNNDAWDRAVQEYQLGQQAWQRDYQLQQDERSNLLQLMQMGYTPSEEDLRAAGMTSNEADTWLNYINSRKSGGVGNPEAPDDTNKLNGDYNEWRDYLHEQMAIGEINEEQYRAYMMALFPTERSAQVAEENKSMSEEDRRKLEQFRAWSMLGGGN